MKEKLLQNCRFTSYILHVMLFKFTCYAMFIELKDGCKIEDAKKHDN